MKKAAFRDLTPTSVKKVAIHDLTPGTRLGPYEVGALIGAGGMGEVYRARDTRLRREVALKVLPELFAADPERLARFQREAEVLASLNHPNIAAIYGLEVAPLDVPSGRRAEGPVRALVLELVDGETLAERIARGPLPLDEALPIARQIADALQAAHEQGVTHRDLKPANIKVNADGVVKVLDFGLAKLMSPAAPPPREGTAGDVQPMSFSPTITSPVMATGVGVLLGTAPYMSPEQAKGREADRRSDVWAFGCVLFEMLTGKRAFDGEDVSDTLATILKGEPPWHELPLDVPAPIRGLIRRCLEKDRRRRIADVSSALVAIDDLPVPTAGVAAPRRRAAATAAAAAAVLAALSTGAFAGWWLRTAPARSAPASYEWPLPAGQQFSFLGRHLVALSPRGTHLVYVANNQLYLRATQELAGAPIRGTEGGRAPFFSPDGESIAFWAAGSLRRVALSGGAPVDIAVAQNPLGASWGADDVIVYSQGAQGIWAVRGTGGTPRRIVTVAENETAQSPQMLSPNRVLFTVSRNDDWGSARIVVQELDSGERKDLVPGQDGRYVETGHIVYLLDRTLFAAAFAADADAPASGPVSMVEGVAEAISGLSGAAHFALGGEGTLAYVPVDAIQSPGSAPRVMVWVHRDGREEPVGAPARSYVYPRLSPDGTRIAVDIRDQENDIWIWDLSGRTPLRQLTFGSDFELYAVWVNPDEIIYSAGPAPAVVTPRALFRRDARPGGAAREILRHGAGVYPNAVSRTGDLLFRWLPAASEQAGVGGSDLMILPAAGGSPRPLFGATSDSEMNAELSPDESMVAYQSDEVGARVEIWVRPFPNTAGPGQRVTYSGGTRPRWSHDGKELFYESGGALMSVPVTPGPTFGNPHQVVGPKYFLGDQAGSVVAGGAAGRMYDVSRDGSRFLMLKNVPPGDDVPSVPSPRIVFIQDWFEQLRTRVR